jgi:hypothetical protein
MNFADAVQTQESRTTNGMKALAGSGDACVDLFYKVGALRKGDPIPPFTAALAENEDLALRIVQWARDVRGGSGEREVFRKILAHMENRSPELASKLIDKIPEIGRWDDLFVLKSKALKEKAFTMLGDALRAKNGLAAKWTPRKGPIANELRAFFGMTPKQYRKSLVALTNVVEQQMCARNWDDINFSHVPSVAASRYKKAFLRNAPTEYSAYVAKLAAGDKSVKINASAIFPHDVLKDVLVRGSVQSKSGTILDAITAQWDALPNYVGDSSVLALVDVSGSMDQSAGGTSVTCHQVALSLGLYTADKNKGPFKDTFLTFSSKPELMHLKGNIIQKLEQMNQSNWDMSTNVIAAFDKILSVATKGGVADADMPKTLLILSDMQFDQCARFDDSAFEAVKRRFSAAGYSVPNIVFWNLNASSNVPVKSNDQGVALVSGFSPAILGTILGSSEDFTPYGMMLKAVMSDRYAL